MSELLYNYNRRTNDWRSFMSRNTFILLFAILVIIYLVMPSEGIYGSIKANVILALPFLMIGVIIYLFTTVIVMRRAWRKLDNNVIDDNVIAFAKIMNISFDVKRMMGVNNLLDLYTKVNFSRHASMKAKERLTICASQWQTTSLRICRLEEDKLNFLKETIHKDAILFQALLCNRMASCYFSYTFLPSKKMPRRFRKNALTFKIKRLNVLKKSRRFLEIVA